MVKQLITDISEEDFRKLDLVAYRAEMIDKGDHFSQEMVPVKLNDVLDENLNYWINQGYESDFIDLNYPVTIAIHESFTDEDIEKTMKDFPNLTDDEIKQRLLFACSYLDKFMNRYSGIQTYQFAMGIKHLYSTRDYYEMRGDYWRVRKDETKVIYRIKLDKKWFDKFELKHKTTKSPWPYSELPEGIKEGFINATLEINYDKANGEWIEKSRCGVFSYDGHSCIMIPVDENGKAKKLMANIKAS